MTEKLKFSETRRRIRKVGVYHLVLFILPALSLLYYGWLRAPELNTRPDNPHRVAPLNQRGKILDRNGKPLATIIENKRVYPAGECAGSLVGYELRGRNQTGLEAALQGEISPPLPAATLTQALRQDREISAGLRPNLHGPDFHLTLDLALQKLVYEVMQKYPGAAVIADSRGRILASVSSPSFNPNFIRERWQELRSDPSSPFIERVGSGLYPVTNKDLSPILSRGISEHHPWLSKDPFPDYPLASEAAWIENRLFLTPLMLLEYSYQLSEKELPSSLTLRSEPKPKSSKRSLPSVSKTSPHSEDESITYWRLNGPSFRDSPEFLAVLGHTSGGFHFSLVIETASEESLAHFEERILPFLRRELGEGLGQRAW